MTQYLDNIDGDLIHALGCPEDLAPQVASSFQKALQLSGFVNLGLENNPYFLAIMFGQCAAESSGFTRTREGLSYSTPAILARNFSRIHALPAADQAKYLRNPQGLANFVYANMYGNGNEASGDGYRYSGRGYIQTTFKANYATVSALAAVDFVAHPELMEQPDGAASSALAFFVAKRIPVLCTDLDRATVDRVTKLVNPAMLKADERFQYAQVAYTYLTKE